MSKNNNNQLNTSLNNQSTTQTDGTTSALQLQRQHRIDINAAKATKEKIRNCNKEHNLVIKPKYGETPTALMSEIEAAVESEENTVFNIFGAEVRPDYLIIRFDNQNSKEQLIKHLTDKKIIGKTQIKTAGELKGDRFLIKDLDPAKFKTRRDADKLNKAVIKFLEKNPLNVEYGMDVLQIVDVDDGNAIAIVKETEAANYLVQHPNIFIGLTRAVAVLYPPGPFCDTCCSLVHDEADCMGGVVRCYMCGGEHPGKKCRTTSLCCPNCRRHPKFKKRTRHSAKSSLCKTRIEATLVQFDLEL